MVIDFPSKINLFFIFFFKLKLNEQIDQFDNNMEEEEDQTIGEEYRIWKKNAPYLYDVLLTGGFDWPSLTINWLPTIDM